MKRTFLLLLTNVFLVFTYAQHIYPEKYKNCGLTSFCLDCGDNKAEPPKRLPNEIIRNLDKRSLNKIKGVIELQILIDETGKPCLLSSLNKTNVSSKQLNLQEAINNTSMWIPAISKNQKTNSSVSLVLEFQNGQYAISRKVYDFTNQSNMRSVGTPNERGTSKDKLSRSWTVYNQQNSELPWDMTRAVGNDLDNSLWIGTDNGIVKIENNQWTHFNSKNTIISSTLYNKNETQSVRDLEVDKENNKWFIIGWDVYKYNNVEWIKYDSINSPINWARKIFVDHSNSVWFTSSKGVAKFDGKQWSEYTKQNNRLPTNKTLGVYVDKKDKIWIGTFEGNVVIENGVTTLLDDVSSPLSKAFISKMFEDKKGNLWFNLYKQKSGDAGIYVLDTLGKWTRIVHPNPRMFSENSINDFYLDEENNLLWLTLNGVGVLNFDLLSKKWETYTNQNSNVPSVHAEKISMDKSGSIWIATYAGVIKSNP